MESTVLLVTGTGTDVGKTIVTAAVAALARARGRSVAVLKPGQTGVEPGEPGDLAEILRLAGPVTTSELARYPEPLAPATAAARSGLPTIGPEEIAAEAARLAASHDLVLVEGAGGLLVRYDEDGHTLADVPKALTSHGLSLSTLLVVTAGLGTLNHTALTAEALRARAIPLLGLVVGSLPADPDLATRCNLTDLPLVADAPLLGALPHGLPDAADFPAAARAALGPALGGTWRLV